jgi:iron complex transport system substrate-binding protein
VLRRTLALTAGLALAAGVLSACSTGPADQAAQAAPSTSPSADASAFPVTIDNATFGPVTIDRQPTRIATLDEQDADNLLSLGIVPVGMTKVSWGADAKGSTPWFEEALSTLGGTAPAEYSDADSVPVDDIAKAAPDLILATNYSLTKQQYAQLSKIAPVVAYPADPWETTWQDSLELVGKATGLDDKAQQVEQQTQAAIEAAKTANPAIVGKTFIWGALATTDLSSISFYSPADARPSFLTQLGMENAPVVEQLSKKGQFYSTISAERAADLKSDVFLSYATADSDAKTYTDDRLIGQIPAIKAGHLATFLADPTALSAGVTDPLSIPYAIAHFVPKIATALGS